MDKTWSYEINDRERASHTDAGATENALDQTRAEILQLLGQWRLGDGLRLRIRVEIDTPPIP